jgi:elongation factor Ts
MATISAAQVKELREKTGAGMMDCKTALTETDGDMEAAVDWLRAKGLAKAAKKAGRVAAEGLVGVSEGDGRAAVVEVNSETDFVARNETFQDMVATIADVARDTGGDTAALAAAEFPGAGKSVEDHVTAMVATIGENLSLRRSAVLSVNNGVVASYMHGAVKGGLGRIGVLVALESTGDKAALLELGKQIAMHVAATSPLSVSVADLDPTVVERERQVLTEQARESGKPDNVIEKMIEGRLRKYYEEVVLLSQAFVINPDQTVEQAVKEAEGSVGTPVKVTAFERFAIGEGIEKDESDFAAEVAAAAQG